MNKEIRFSQPAEIRAEGDDIRVEGYAAVFNEETNIGDWFREVIAPGAFRDAIGRDDVVFLVNHEGLPLARTRSGTLSLVEDGRGLLMSASLDQDDPDVQQIVPKMKRGDLDKMSFAFRAEAEKWEDDGDADRDMPLRTVERASLYDVSIVTNPAYDGTEIGLRGLEMHRQSKTNNHAIRARMKARLHDTKFG